MATLKEIRGNRSMTQFDLAGASGLSPITISRYERGTEKPSLRSARKMAKALKVKPSDIDECKQALVEKDAEGSGAVKKEPQAQQPENKPSLLRKLGSNLKRLASKLKPRRDKKEKGRPIEGEITEPKPEPTPEPEPVPEPEPEPIPEPEPEPTPGPKVITESKPVPVPEPEPVSVPEPELPVADKPKLELKPKSNPKVKLVQTTPTQTGKVVSPTLVGLKNDVTEDEPGTRDSGVPSLPPIIGFLGSLPWRLIATGFIIGGLSWLCSYLLERRASGKSETTSPPAETKEPEYRSPVDRFLDNYPNN